jgi:hypothetical protein
MKRAGSGAESAPNVTDPEHWPPGSGSLLFYQRIKAILDFFLNLLIVRHLFIQWPQKSQGRIWSGSGRIHNINYPPVSRDP